MIKGISLLNSILSNNTIVVRQGWTTESMVVPLGGFVVVGVLLFIILFIICTGYLDDEDDEDDFMELSTARLANSTPNGCTEISGKSNNGNQTIEEPIGVYNRLKVAAI